MPRNALPVDLAGVSGVTVRVEEAGLDPTEPIEVSVESAHEGTVTIAGSAGTHEVAVSSGDTARTGRVCDG